MPLTRAPGIIGVGYEGRDVDGFLHELTPAGVEAVADVRLTPVSRKRGFSKRGLGEALASVGIGYEHLPMLGNPKPNRAGFAGSALELLEARARYEEHISTHEAEKALDHLEDLARHALVALVCFEADQQRCHRHIVLSQLHDRLERIGLPV